MRAVWGWIMVGYPPGGDDLPAARRASRPAQARRHLPGLLSKEMGAATKQLRDPSCGYRGRILANTDLDNVEALHVAGAAAEGVLFAEPLYDTDRSKEEAVRSYVAEFRRYHGRYPTLVEANSYDAVNVIAAAISDGRTNRPAIAEYLARLKDYPGAAGRITFVNGEPANRPIVIKLIRGGKATAVSSTAELIR